MKLQGTVIMLLISWNILLLAMQTEGDDIPQEQWSGRWFPSAPDENMLQIHDNRHGIVMGVPTVRCDDAKTNLSVDWEGSSIAYTCYDFRKLYKPNVNTEPVYRCQHIPKEYWALHKCMNETITYDETIPTFGTHRPLWPRYGEYRYLPVQRWLHSLEHGAIVLLYHPCADDQQVNHLRTLVTNCLYRHVITPYDLLPPDRPLAIVAWGCRLTFSVVDADLVRTFIKSHALNGPEQISRDGQYELELVAPARRVTDAEDSVLCPT